MTKEVMQGEPGEQFYRYNFDDGSASDRTIGL